MSFRYLELTFLSPKITYASGNGWKHDGLIFVYGTPVPGTEPFSVGHAEPVWRYRIVPGQI